MSRIERVWQLFAELNKIPRPSHNEGRMADYLCQFAEKNNLDYDRDAQNCVVIRKPASAGYEDLETIVLLNHMDMVCVCDKDKTYNPLTDSIETQMSGGWMSAKGTSLGADNGIGLSIAMAIMEDRTLQHGPLEMLTTTNEEDGMTGAANLSPDFIKGRKVLNLDSEDYDTITIGAAGAYMQTHTWNMAASKADKSLRYTRITISGGQGGHSGVDINKGRANAIKLLGELLFQLGQQTEIRIADLNGGNSSAAIATQASATVATKKDIKEVCNRIATALLNPYKETDSDMRICAEGGVEEVKTLNATDSVKIANALHEIPYGVLEMRTDMPGTVQSSSNIGLLHQNSDKISLSTHTRSFSDKEKERIGKDIASIVKKYGGATHLDANSPAWQENGESAFIDNVSRCFEEELGFRPKKVAMHFVLEAGYFAKKYPGIEIACIGPRIVEPHSVKERVEMKTVEDILRVVVKIICCAR